MPLLLLLLFLLPLLFVVLIPVSLLQRYRVGTMRRPARGWVATLNLVLIAFSIAMFLAGAAVTNVWVPDALRYALAGLAAGGALGLLGLVLSRWERMPGSLYYTPNRWLVLAITLVVSVRLLYGFWRAWQTWRFSPDETSWAVASGVAGSLAAGAIVLGYYFVYWFGLRTRLKRHLRSHRVGGLTHMSKRVPLLVVLGFMIMPAAWLLAQEGTAVRSKVAEVERVAARGPFAPDWTSLARFQVPDWYQDAKFGIFIHWGVYSVPAFGNEWYPRNMYKKDEKEFAHHVETYGPQSRFGYKDFIPKLTAERFDAAKWAALFKAAGARYVVPVAEHHDGFAMYDSALTRWSAAKMGPRRDVIGELAKAVRAEGLVFGLSSHRVEHWWFFDQGKTFDSDVRDPAYADFYGPAVDQKTSEAQQTPPDRAFLEDWLARCAELVDKYRPQLVWFDWWIAQPPVHPYLQRFAAFYYNRGAEWKSGVAINYKKHGGESFPDTAGVLDVERGQLAGIRPLFWQTDTSVSKNSWGYIANHDYKTSDSLVDDLVDIVSKNGALLLNIGPKPDGTIPEPEERILREIGTWLSANGDAIYGTRPWTMFGEGPTAVVEGPFADTKRAAFTDADIRFTTRGDSLYAIALAWPASGTVHVKALAAGSPHLREEIASVELLGGLGDVRWKRDGEGLHLELPPAPAARPPAVAFRISRR